MREHTYRRRIQQSAARLQQVAATGAFTDLDALVAAEHAAVTAAARRLSTTPDPTNEPTPTGDHHDRQR